MIEIGKTGRVAGSIDVARLLELYEQATDGELKAHYAELLPEGVLPAEAEKVTPPEEAAPPPEPESEPEDEIDDLRAQAEALGVKVDGRWGADRLRQEIENAEEE